MQLGFFFDQQRCVGCQTCVVACKEWHDVPAGPASWRWLQTMEEGTYPQVWMAHLSLSCLHCAEPTCVPACPAGAITKRDRDGIVIVNRDLCIPGCRSCLDACPYKAPQFRSESSRMEMCDFCVDLIEQGKKPVCAASCPLRALEAGPVEDLKKTFNGSECAPGFTDHSPTKPSILFRPRRR